MAAVGQDHGHGGHSHRTRLVARLVARLVRLGGPPFVRLWPTVLAVFTPLMVRPAITTIVVAAAMIATALALPVALAVPLPVAVTRLLIVVLRLTAGPFGLVPFGLVLAMRLALWVLLALVTGRLEPFTRVAVDRLVAIVEASAAITQVRLTHAPGIHRARTGEAISRRVVAVVVAHVVHVVEGLTRATGAAHAVAVLTSHLVSEPENDAIVVLGVLEIVLRQHRIAGRLSVTGESRIFVGNVLWIAADFHIGSVRLEAARQRILGFAATATPPPIVLSLPHGLQLSHVLGGCNATVGARKRSR
jgi:hypothetical protein